MHQARAVGQERDKVLAVAHCRGHVVGMRGRQADILDDRAWKAVAQGGTGRAWQAVGYEGPHAMAPLALTLVAQLLLGRRVARDLGQVLQREAVPGGPRLERFLGPGPSGGCSAGAGGGGE